MEKLENTDKKGISTKRKIGKTTYEVVVHFNKNTTETMQVKDISQLLFGQISINRIDEQSHPRTMSLLIFFKQFYRMDTAHRFHKIGILLGIMYDIFFGSVTQRIIRHDTDNDIQCQSNQHCY